MYINNIVNFQESTTILNAHMKTSGNLPYAPRIYKHDFALNDQHSLIWHKTQPINLSTEKEEINTPNYWCLYEMLIFLT